MSFFVDKQIILMGGLNVDLNQENNAQVKNFLNFFKSNGFKQHIRDRTHINLSTGIINSLLDFAFSNFGHSRISTEVIEVYFSDNFIVSVSLASSIDSAVRRMKFRDFSLVNVNKFIGGVSDNLDTYL